MTLENNDLNLVLEIPVEITVELGSARIPIKQLMGMAEGTVLELNTMTGAPLDIYANGYLIAQGEVVVANEHYGIKITDILSPADRIRKLSKKP
jgi:flagellar motor switch protein FliN/FliY